MWVFTINFFQKHEVSSPSSIQLLNGFEQEAILRKWVKENAKNKDHQFGHSTDV